MADSFTNPSVVPQVSSCHFYGLDIRICKCYQAGKFSILLFLFSTWYLNLMIRDRHMWNINAARLRYMTP